MPMMMVIVTRLREEEGSKDKLVMVILMINDDNHGYDDDKYNYKAEKKRKEPKASLCRAKSSMLGTIERSSRENTCGITIISSFDNER